MADTGIGRNFSPKENSESSPYPPPSKNPRESSKSKTECLLEISEATWYNINKQSSDEIKKIFPFTVVCYCYVTSVVSDSGQPHPWDSPGKNTGVGYHFLLQCIKVKSESEVAQLCLTLRNPMDCSLPGSSVHGILQARVLEWGAIAFSITVVYTRIKYLQIMLIKGQDLFTENCKSLLRETKGLNKWRYILS